MAKKISFRTIHDHIDVSAIAAEFGGGGHQKAAGCSLTDDAYEQYVAQIFHIAPIPEDAKRNRYNLRFSSFGTMYKNLKEELFLLYSISDFDWVIEKNKLPLDQIFTSFYEAEWFLKRNYQAWLVKDELFVDYLMEEAKKVRHQE